MTPITHKRAKAALAALWLATPGWATDLALPVGARMTLETRTDSASYRLPIGPWQEEQGIPVRRVEGAITRQAWRVEGQSLTTLQLLAPLRAQLETVGYEILFECAASACGGFDFRFETEVLKGPAMYVNLSDYQFLSAARPGTSSDSISLLVSRSIAAGFVQIIRARGDGAPVLPAVATQPPALPQTTDAFAQRLESAGHVALLDLQFTSGSADLGDGPIASLDEIAAYLVANPTRRMVFVGHTDATGSLAANIALSRRRAAAAVTYLTTRHGIARSRISSDGVGFLSPLSSNLTEAGRLLNRRVEAVLISTE